ncbi:O-antigen ligase family protein, partial [bacterium AH-315-P15]|nr:O-antigen ligase family protein [bacterium AH-315-P15]
RRETAVLALQGVVLVGAIYSILALITFSPGGGLLGWLPDRGLMAGPFDSKNSFATFLGLGLICAFCLAVNPLGQSQGGRRWARVTWRSALTRPQSPFFLHLVATLLLGMSFLLAQSRGATLALGIALLLAVALMIWARLVSLRGIGPMALMVGAPLAVMGNFASSGILGRFGRLGLFDFGRGDVFAATMNAIDEAMVMGTGAGAFSETFPFYRFSNWGLVNVWDYAHNGYLEIALGLGVPAAMIVFSLIAWMVWRLAQSLWFRRARLFGVVGLSASLFVAIHAGLDFSMQIPGVAILYAYLMGICVAQTYPRNRAGR